MTRARRPRRGVVGLILALALGFAPPGPVLGAEPSTSLPGPVLGALKRAGLSPAALSVRVEDLASGEVVLSYQPDQPRNPASVMKVLTTYVALAELGPAYTWRTEAYGARLPKAGELAGDFYLKGYGDPFLVQEHFWRLLRGVRQSGVEAIAGDLVLDQSYFIPRDEDPGDFDRRPQRAYNVGPQALLINFQATAIRFMPQPEAGRVQLAVDPLPSAIAVENRLRLTQGGCAGFAREVGVSYHEQPKPRLVLSGNYSAACGDNELFRAFLPSAQHALGAFETLWRELGGRFGGAVREAAVPTGARLLYTHESPPLADIVRGINKYSNNVMTRSLLLTLGAERGGAPGTEERGVQVVTAWLREHGLEFRHLVLENGSGLSRNERITAAELAALLRHAYHSPYMPEFMSSLPLLAVDGTLKRRMNGSELAGRGHLKTGHLTGVSSQAGYFLDAHGRRLLVVSLENDPRVTYGAGETVQNALLRWLYERP